MFLLSRNMHMVSGVAAVEISRVGCYGGVISATSATSWCYKLPAYCCTLAARLVLSVIVLHYCSTLKYFINKKILCRDPI